MGNAEAFCASFALIKGPTTVVMTTLVSSSTSFASTDALTTAHGPCCRISHHAKGLGFAPCSAGHITLDVMAAGHKKAGHQAGFLPQCACMARLCYGSFRYKTVEHICR